MKKILFVVTYFDCGGINRSLQNLLNHIETDKYEIDVFAMVPDGMFRHLYKNCKILPRNMLLSALMARLSQQKGFFKLFCTIIKVANRFSKGIFGNWIKKRSAHKLVNKTKYDAVVAFSEGVPTAFVQLMAHSNSIAWIHCDYASYYDLNNRKDESSIYSCFNHIVCVSEYTKKSFNEIYPELSVKSTAIYNVMDVKMMKDMAKKPLTDEYDTKVVNIVSIGRLDPVKRLSIIPNIANDLLKKGCKFHWYVIGPVGGSSEEYDKLMKGIDVFNLSDCISYLGEQSNPYNYIAHSDLLVNTSISEACPYVVNEAKILGVPVICTDFGSVIEFVDNGINGFVTGIEEMAEAIKNFISDNELRNSLNVNLQHFEYDNDSIIRKVYNLL